ncbi:MbcA/ParS/Xre antitoxin family protein [Duganella sp. Root336D2]
MVARSGATSFDSTKWLEAWLNSPLPALGGVRPGSYLDTMTDQELLAS